MKSYIYVHILTLFFSAGFLIENIENIKKEQHKNIKIFVRISYVLACINFWNQKFDTIANFSLKKQFCLKNSYIHKKFRRINQPILASNVLIFLNTPMFEHSEFAI